MWEFQPGRPLLCSVVLPILEFGIQHYGRWMQPLDPQPALIDRAYEQLVEAIADGTLAPGQRIRQEELGRALGVSRQPISHALQLLKQQKLVEENGRRGLIVSGIDAERIRELYQVRTALDALAARLAAERIAGRVIDMQQRRAAQRALAAGLALRPDAPVLAFIQADVAFHTALYRLSGNRAIEDAVAAQWPHLKRSMGRCSTIPSSARWSGPSTTRSSASFSPAMLPAPSERPEAIPTAPAAKPRAGSANHLY